MQSFPDGFPGLEIVFIGRGHLRWEIEGRMHRPGDAEKKLRPPARSDNSKWDHGKEFRRRGAFRNRLFDPKPIPNGRVSLELV